MRGFLRPTTTVNYTVSSNLTGSFPFIQSDDNRGTELVFDPTAVVQIDAVINGIGTNVGSGVIIGSHSILTAAHIVWSTDTQQSATSITIYPYGGSGSPISGVLPSSGAVATNSPNTEVGTNGMQLSFYAIDDTSVNYGMVDQPIPPQRLDFAVIYTSQLLTPYGSVSIVPYVSGNVNVEGLPGAAPGGAAPLFYGAETGVTPSSGVFDYVDGTFFPNPYNTDGSFPGAPGMSGGPALQDSAAGLLQDVGVDSLDGDAVELTSGDLATIQDWEAGTPETVATFTADQAALDKVVGGFAISDTAANVAAKLDALDADPHINAIALTDAGVPVLSLTAAQSVNDTTALGKIPNSVFEVSTGASNSYYANGTSITLSASNANVYLRASSGLSLSGGSDWVDGLGSGDPVSLSGSDNNWDYVTATGATITLNGAQTSVAGGGDTINYASGNGNAVDIYKTGGSADTVTATGSAIYLNSAQAHVTGGGDWIDFQSGSGNAVTLAGTSNNWDWVTAADATVDFDGAQATVAGGGDTIAFQSGSGNSLAITGTGGSADAITASANNIYMLGAEATVTGGGEWVDFQGGTDSVKLANTGGDWDWVTAAGGAVDFDGAQATVAGGGDTIAFTGGSGNSVALTGTASRPTASRPPTAPFIFLARKRACRAAATLSISKAAAILSR